MGGVGGEGGGVGGGEGGTGSRGGGEGGGGCARKQDSAHVSSIARTRWEVE